MGKEVGHFIKEWRNAKEMSQHELARLANMSPPAISMLESGNSKYTQRTLVPIAEALGVKPGTLLDKHPYEIMDEGRLSDFAEKILGILARVEPEDMALAEDILEALAKHKPQKRKRSLTNLKAAHPHYKIDPD